MAVWTYSGNVYNSSPAGTTTFPLVSGAGYKIDYLQRSHIHVYNSVDEGSTWIELTTPTDYSLNAEGTEVVLVAGIEDGTFVKVQRHTPYLDEYVNFQSSSLLTADQLNTAELFSMYVDQEQSDQISLLSSVAIKFLGNVDLTVDSAPASPTADDFYINTGSGVVVSGWTGIEGDTVSGSEQVIYNGITAEWQIVGVPSGQAGVLSVTGTAPIVVDNTDVQRPVVGITNATASADGAMSSTDKGKLDDIENDAQVNVNADWNAASGDAEILNKPTIPAAQVNSDWSATSGVEKILNKPSIPDAQVNSDWNATSGVAKILNKPSIPAAQVNSDWDATSGAAKILNKPAIIPEAPADGKTYGRKNTQWSEVEPGGVTKIVAGNNVTISPTGGTGVVTVNSTGGGGGGGAVDSVNGKTGVVVLSASDVGAATAAQGTKADSALQPGDNISELTNDENYITAADIPSAPVESVNGETGVVELGLNSLDDVSVGGVSTGNILSYNGSSWIATTSPPADISGSSINQLNDVDASSATSGQVMVWNGTNNWVPGDMAGGAVDSVNGEVGAVVLDASDVGAATAAQGTKADSALQPGDDVSELNNDAGYITAGDVPSAPVTSVNSKTGTVVLSASDVGAATTTQGSKADSALQPGDNISELNNNAGYITAGGIPAAPVDSVNGETGVVVLTYSDVGAMPLDLSTLSELV